MDIVLVYNLETLIVSLSLAVFYAIVLVKVNKGSKFYFVMIVAALMMASNLAAIPTDISNIMLTKVGNSTNN